MIIKFRAWLKDDKKMVPVWQMFFSQQYGETRVMVKSPKTGRFMIGVFPLMQSIGIKDENGKQIYEGDVMEFDFHDIGKQKAVVYFNQRFTSFSLRPLDNFQYTDFQDGVVLGNIYENPELLEESKCSK